MYESDGIECDDIEVDSYAFANASGMGMGSDMIVPEQATSLGAELGSDFNRLVTYQSMMAA